MLPQAKLLPLFVALVLGGDSVVVGENATVTETPSSTVDSELLAIDELFEKTSQEVRQRIMKRLLPVLNEVLYDPKLSTKCAGALLKVGTALRTNEMWVLQMLDSIGRPPAGMMSGRLADYGAYDQCLAMRHPQMAFQGKYCLLNFKAPRLTPRVFRASNKYIDHFNLKFTGNISCALESEISVPRPFEDVTGLGVCQMGHVWLCSLKSSYAKQRLLKLGLLTIRGKLCIPVDPNRQEVRVKLHWVPFDVPNEVLRKALEEFGSVGEVTRQKWRVDGFEDIE
ncbi:hypothetical protein ISCGN_014697 [Ixodes scapularis]